MNEIEAQVREVLGEMYPDVDFDTEDNLTESGILDSLSIIELTATLEDVCDVQFSPMDMTPENLASLSSITSLVSSKLED